MTETNADDQATETNADDQAASLTESNQVASPKKSRVKTWIPDSITGSARTGTKMEFRKSPTAKKKKRNKK